MTAAGPRLAGSLLDQQFQLAGANGTIGMMRSIGSDQPLFKVITHHGYEICAASSHLVYRSRDKSAEPVPLRDVAVGDRLMLAQHLSPQVDRNDPTFVEGWVLGHMKGNGGHNPLRSGGTYLRFWDGEDDALIERATWFAFRLGARSNFRGSYGADGIVTVRTAGLSDFANQFLVPESKDIRRSLVEAVEPLVAGFIQGFFDADGTVQRNSMKGRSIRLNQSDYGALRVLQQMLLRLGIVSKIYSRRPEQEKLMPDGRGGHKLYPTRENWDLVIANDNIERFASTISLSKPTKRSALEHAVLSLVRKPNAERFVAKVINVERIADGPALICRGLEHQPYDAAGFRSLDIDPRRRSR